MEQNNKLQLAQLVEEKNKTAVCLFAEALHTTLFPMEDVSGNWIQAVRQAIIQSSPLSHRLPLKEFGQVVVAASKLETFKENSNKLNLFEFGVLSNALETVSPNDLSVSPTVYGGIVEEAIIHIETYQKMVAKIRTEIDNKVEADFKMKAASVVNLKPVAEA